MPKPKQAKPKARKPDDETTAHIKKITEKVLALKDLLDDGTITEDEFRYRKMRTVNSRPGLIDDEIF